METARKGSRIEKFNTLLLKRFVADYENVHDTGMCKIVTIHILIDKDLTVEASHVSSHEVATRIRESMPGATTEVHVGPAYKLKSGSAPRV